MGFLNRLFAKRDATADFSRHLPVLAQATHNIAMGIYWRLSKRYEKKDEEVDPYKLAYAVVYDLMQNENGKRSLGDFVERNADLIAKEVRHAATDKEIRDALSLEYAGRLMAVSYGTGKPLSEAYLTRANIIVEQATDLGVEITNIVSLWGSQAIVNLYAFSKKFREKNL